MSSFGKGILLFTALGFIPGVFLIFISGASGERAAFLLFCSVLATPLVLVGLGLFWKLYRKIDGYLS